MITLCERGLGFPITNLTLDLIKLKIWLFCLNGSWFWIVQKGVLVYWTDSVSIQYIRLFEFRQSKNIGFTLTFDGYNIKYNSKGEHSALSFLFYDINIDGIV